MKVYVLYNKVKSKVTALKIEEPFNLDDKIHREDLVQLTVDLPDDVNLNFLKPESFKVYINDNNQFTAEFIGEVIDENTIYKQKVTRTNYLIKKYFDKYDLNNILFLKLYIIKFNIIEEIILNESLTFEDLVHIINDLKEYKVLILNQKLKNIIKSNIDRFDTLVKISEIVRK